MPSERTLILFKPDAVQRRLVGRILARIEDKGLRIVGLKMMEVTGDLAKRHYAEHVDKPFYPSLEEFITSGPVIALVAEGPSAISVVRTVLGATNGREAAPGTIRGDFGQSRQMNLLHGSDGVTAAEKEIGIYFSADELLDYESTLDVWGLAADEK